MQTPAVRTCSGRTGVPEEERHLGPGRRRVREQCGRRLRLRAGRGLGGCREGVGSGSSFEVPRCPVCPARWDFCRVRPGRRQLRGLFGKTLSPWGGASGLSAPDGTLVWISSALAGRSHDLTAACSRRVIATCIRLGIRVLAGKGCQGAGGPVALAGQDPDTGQGPHRPAVIRQPGVLPPPTAPRESHRPDQDLAHPPQSPDQPQQTHVNHQGRPHPEDSPLKNAQKCWSCQAGRQTGDGGVVAEIARGCAESVRLEGLGAGRWFGSAVVVGRRSRTEAWRRPGQAGVGTGCTVGRSADSGRAAVRVVGVVLSRVAAVGEAEVGPALRGAAGGWSDGSEIGRWIVHEWPRSNRAMNAGARIAFLDESGVFLLHRIGRTCSPRGRTSLVRHYVRPCPMW